MYVNRVIHCVQRLYAGPGIILIAAVLFVGIIATGGIVGANAHAKASTLPRASTTIRVPSSSAMAPSAIPPMFTGKWYDTTNKLNVYIPRDGHATAWWSDAVNGHARRWVRLRMLLHRYHGGLRGRIPRMRGLQWSGHIVAMWLNKGELHVHWDAGDATFDHVLPN